MTKTKKGGGGDRRAEATTKTKTNKGGGGGDAAVVLRMELHCEGCALKVRRAIKGAQGAESVRTDVAASTVTVAGKADPWDLRDRIQAKIARRNKPAIEFVSPANPPRPPPKPKDDGKRWWWYRYRWRWSIRITKKKGRHDKQMPPPESTVVLSIQLHCTGCTYRIKRKARKIKGVKQVTIDTAKQQVTVKGTMDAKALPDILSAKLNGRRVTAVVVPPTTNKSQDKKAAEHHDSSRDEQGEEEAGGGGTSTTTAGDANKKNKNCKQQPRGPAAVAGDDHDYEVPSWMSPGQQYQASYGRGDRVGLLQAFSDENPNACSLM